MQAIAKVTAAGLLVLATAARAAAADPNPDPASACDAALEAFVAEHRVLGCAVAIARDGRPVYARGCGWADAARSEPVTPRHRFRIASVSKAVTAAAVLRLVDLGRVTLAERVFDRLALEPRPGAAPPDPRLREITVEHLLTHRGGWAWQPRADPMFQAVHWAKRLGTPPPASAQDIIRGVLELPLDHAPGSTVAYSNLGYSVLGRLVEQVAGADYEAFVRAEILAPAGIEGMRLGRTRAADRAEGEVEYMHPGTAPSVFAVDLGRPVPVPYGGFHLEAMDAHGGWIASVLDLLAFARAIDPAASNPVLSAESSRRMVEPVCPAEPGVWQGLGWAVRPAADRGRPTSWLVGRFPGSTAILIRRHDGLDAAAVFNTAVDEAGRPLVTTAEPLLHRLMNRHLGDDRRGDQREAAHSDRPDDPAPEPLVEPRASPGQ